MRLIAIVSFVIGFVLIWAPPTLHPSARPAAAYLSQAGAR
jgi:hypothetical protein